MLRLFRVAFQVEIKFVVPCFYLWVQFGIGGVPRGNWRWLLDEIRGNFDANRVLTDNGTGLAALVCELVASIGIRATNGHPLASFRLKGDVGIGEGVPVERYAAMHRSDLRSTLAATGRRYKQRNENNCSTFCESHDFE